MVSLLAMARGPVPRAIASVFICCAVALIGCAVPSVPADTDGAESLPWQGASGQPAEDSSEREGSMLTAPANVCAPGESFCLDTRTAMQCSLSGDEFLVVDCPEGMGCHDETGVCRLRICDPGEVTCAGSQSQKTCLESGTGWSSDTTVCEGSDVCWEGSCQLCVPQQSFCLDGTTTAQCDGDGLGYSQTAQCPIGEACHELTGSCREPVCEPFSTNCADAFHVSYCLPSGTGWTEDTTTCMSQHLCYEGQCIYAPCIPSVMVLVDGSSSMSDKWEDVQQSVFALANANPEVLFGINFFPSNAGCGVTGSPHVPVNKYAADELIAVFDDWEPLGATPLAAAMVSLLEDAPQVFGDYGGSLVVLSDGEDSCGTEVGGPTLDVLDAATRALFEDHDVKTYVIGYDYEGDSAALDIIADAGGTGLDSHVMAGNEEELVTAFDAVLNDVKICSSRAP
jgi:hypothetical protein